MYPLVRTIVPVMVFGSALQGCAVGPDFRSPGASHGRHDMYCNGLAGTDRFSTSGRWRRTSLYFKAGHS